MGLKEELQKEYDKLRVIKEKAEDGLRDAPEGKLRLGKSNGCVQYYHCLPEGPRLGRYLQKKEMNFVKRLAQKSYNERVFKQVSKRISQIGRILKDYENDEVENCFLREHPMRQELITPVEPTYQQKLETWLATPFTGKAFKEDYPVIMTNNGIRVRSKSEKILADYFDSAGIIYKYECPIYLKPYGIVYPDFTFLSKKTGKEIYWEHEGMMDNPEYARAAVKKIELYEKNEIYPGERLILTFETSISVINTALIKKMAERYSI